MQINQRSYSQDTLYEGCIKLSDELIQYYTRNYSDYPPFHPDRIAKNLNIKIEEKKINRSGCVSTYQEKKSIILNEDEDFYRKRFTCAHELAHIFFHDKMLTIEDIDIERLERLCNTFAGNFLMPSGYLTIAFQNIEDNFNFEMLEKIRKDFKVNLKALIYRIDELKLVKNPNQFILLIESKVNKYTKNDEKLRVSWSILPAKANFYIPENIGADTLGLSTENFKALNLSESTPVVTENIISSVIDAHSGKYKKKEITCNAKYRRCGYEGHEYILGLFNVINPLL